MLICTLGDLLLDVIVRPDGPAAPDGDTPATTRPALGELGPELVFANEEERDAVGGLDADWVVKLGPRGARFPEGELPARPAEVVDATGAGDALAAGYLVGGPEVALAAAARCVGRMGAMPW